MRSRTIPLRWHLTVFGLLVVSPIFLALVFLSILYVHTQQDAIRAEAESIVREASKLIDNELARDTLALKALSASAILTHDNFASLYKVATKVSEAIPGSAIAVRKPSGEAIFNTSFPFGSELPKLQDENLIAADQAAIRNKKTTVSNVFVGMTGQTFVAIVEPVFENDQPRFLLSLGISTSRISNILNGDMRRSPWLIGVTGTDNKIVGRTWDEDRFVGKMASEAFIKNTEGDSGVFLVRTLDGVDVFDVYIRSKLTGWKIAAGLPVAMYQAPLRHTLYVLGALITFGTVSSIVLSFSYARFLLKPVAALQALVETPKTTNFKLMRSGIKELDDVADVLANSFLLLKDRDQHQQVLVKELNHRAKNALTAIQAIAYATRKYSTSLEDFVRTFDGRLNAMARSYDIITKNDWRAGELKELISECCKPFSDAHRFEIDGPSVLLSPKALVGMGLVIHELATNAIKHGALSAKTGKISIRWQIEKREDRQVVRLTWSERGGPSTTKPAGKGFGTELIKAVIGTDLQGNYSWDISEKGLDFAAIFPVENQSVVVQTNRMG
jgi:two-component sensor histidine kinase